jgi:triosephosphate isomerase (TIM)
MKPLIVANWKCNPSTPKEGQDILKEIKKKIGLLKSEVVVCPPFVYLPVIGKGMVLGAQDAFWEKTGAYTGEISPAMLKSIGCRYIIVGHSERRRLFGETDEMANKKVRAVLAEKMNPILCVDRLSQLKAGIKGLSPKDLKNIAVAFEPLSAIGTGKAYSVGKAGKMYSGMRKMIGKDTRILYGGSVSSGNASSYVKGAGFQGLLVGGASLKPREFIGIIKAIS